MCAALLFFRCFYILAAFRATFRLFGLGLPLIAAILVSANDHILISITKQKSWYCIVRKIFFVLWEQHLTHCSRFSCFIGDNKV
jgi:hypothetical protein